MSSLPASPNGGDGRTDPNTSSDRNSTDTTRIAASPQGLSFMFGAVIGDIAGSTYERQNLKDARLVQIFAPGSKFTDDTVLTLATAKHLLRLYCGDDDDDDSQQQQGVLSKTTAPPVTYATAYQEMGHLYPRAGYGRGFRTWLKTSRSNHHCPSAQYNSYGNGSAMRVSPIAWMAPNLEWCLQQAKESAEVTHNHPEGIKGAQAVAAAIFLARTGQTKDEIRQFVTDRFGYDLNRTVEQIRPSYTFEVSCQKSVPESIIAFLDSNSFEDAIRKAISLGGDSDTIACIAGSIAQAYYRDGIPPAWIQYCREAMDAKLLRIVDVFWTRYENGTLTPTLSTQNFYDADDDDEIEIERAAQVQTPKLSHQDAKAVVQQLLTHVVQCNLSTEHVEALEKLAKDLDRWYLNPPRS